MDYRYSINEDYISTNKTILKLLNSIVYNLYKTVCNIADKLLQWPKNAYETASAGEASHSFISIA